MRKNVLKVLSTTSMLALVIGISSCASVGLTGPTGPQGEVGAQGIQGSSGVSGAPGLQGPTGPAGPQGETGATGSRGPSGSTGSRGADGAPGATGESVVLNPIDLGPTLSERASYAQNRIDEGYIAISSIEDWINFAMNDDTDYYQGRFVLTSDIDFADLSLLNDGNSPPITVYDLIVGRRSDDPTKPFGGKFDGANFSISNLEIIDEDTTSDFGLFHRITDDVEFRNFSLVNFNIQTSGTIGAIGSREFANTPLTSLLVSNVTLKDSYLRSGRLDYDGDGYFVLSDAVGGLFGELDLNYNTIEDIDGNEIISLYGAGSALFENININNSFIFSGESRVGGVVGKFKGDNFTLLNSKNISDVASIDNNAGGFIGRLDANSVIIKNSSNAGSIASFEGSNVSGLVGELWVSDFLNISTSFNSGAISGESNIGGLVGELYIKDSDINDNFFSSRPVLVDINNSYNIGNLVASYAEETVFGIAGGLIGLVDFGYTIRELDLTISNSYSASDIETIYSGGGLIGSAYYTGTSKYTFNNVFTLNNFENLNEQFVYNPLIGSFIDFDTDANEFITGDQGRRDMVITKDAFHLNKYTKTSLVEEEKVTDEERLNSQYGSQFVPSINFFKTNSFIFNNVWGINTTWVFNSSINNGLPTLKNNLHLSSSSTFEVEPSFSYTTEVTNNTLYITLSSDIANYFVEFVVEFLDEFDDYSADSRLIAFGNVVISVNIPGGAAKISIVNDYYDFSGNNLYEEIEIVISN